jgi:hypothetical protein
MSSGIYNIIQFGWYVGNDISEKRVAFVFRPVHHDLFSVQSHHHHYVQEGLGVFPVPWSSKWNWSLHLFLGRPNKGNNTDRESQYVEITGYPWLKWLRERPSMLRYTYIAFLVSNLFQPLYWVSHTDKRKEGQAQRSIFTTSRVEYTKIPDCNKVSLMRLGSERARTLRWRQTGNFSHLKWVLTRRRTTKLTV